VLKFLLDTGASYTTVDFNTVLMAGFDLRNPDRTVLVETSNGVIEA
jgi:predicted aspartyl protease